MKVYFLVAKFNFKRYLVYPIEMISYLIKKVAIIGFLVFFWSVAFKDFSANNLNLKENVSYFIFASGVADITMVDSQILGKFIRRRVKSGEISNYLIKPVRFIPFMYFSSMGTEGMRYILGLASIIIGLLLNLPQSYFGLLFFIPFFINAFLLGLTVNLIEASASFYFTEVSGLKNSLNHIIKVFSGRLVPLTYFPAGLKSIIELSPFPYMVFAPTTSLEIVAINREVIRSLSISTIWALSLTCMILLIFKKALRQYEAIGI